jgi:hypothetical protein
MFHHQTKPKNNTEPSWKNNIYTIKSIFDFSFASTNNPAKPAAPPTIKIGKSSNFELKNGLKVMVVENHKLPRVAYSLSLETCLMPKETKG